MNYNIVTNYRINQIFKQKSKYYKIDLGQAITLESRHGDRELNANDQFAYSYNTYYKTGILRQGNIGDIRFYTNHQILEDIIQLYIGVEEFIHKIDFRKLDEVGIDAYLGEFLKNSTEELESRGETTVETDYTAEDELIAEKIRTNPGSVRYEDLQAYMKRQSQKLAR